MTRWLAGIALALIAGGIIAGAWLTRNALNHTCDLNGCHVPVSPLAGIATVLLWIAAFIVVLLLAAYCIAFLWDLAFGDLGGTE